jgi:hypothetical protein
MKTRLRKVSLPTIIVWRINIASIVIEGIPTLTRTYRHEENHVVRPKLPLQVFVRFPSVVTIVGYLNLGCREEDGKLT